MKRYSAIARCSLFVLVVGLLVLGIVGAQTNSTPANEFLIKGVVASASGPLARVVVIVMPFDPTQGKPVTLQGGAYSTLSLNWHKASKSDKRTYTYSIRVDPRLGELRNPQTTTNAKGAFSVSVPKDLFKKFQAGELGLGVFRGWVSSFEPEIIKYDVNAATVNVGRLVFKPVHVPAN